MTGFDSTKSTRPEDSAKTHLLLLDEQDTVLVCVKTILPGDVFYIGTTPVKTATVIEMGHKIARYPLAVGDKVIKYGAPIGSVTEPVELGGHVHLHNMQSDYIPSHTRQGSSRSRR